MNSHHNDDKVLVFLFDSDMFNLFDDFYHHYPPTYTRSNNTMDIILGSLNVLQWMVNGYILDPEHGPRDHLVIQ